MEKQGPLVCKGPHSALWASLLPPLVIIPVSAAPPLHHLSQKFQSHRQKQFSCQGSPAPFSVLHNLKLLEEELKNPQLTWGKVVRSMAAITWYPSQRRTAAEEKQRKCEASHHPPGSTQPLREDLRHRQPALDRSMNRSCPGKRE